eukprot:TRINITY_DN353_c0_g1_i6.p1 TRINITY_DN353_c0_g1~~TRINITY_DN353_c0_g1_i6.p1  ORF type:complete len:329 (-),score=61.15 TRINITY_DN353_c0_g1_i6:761-1747(-)
MGKGESADTPSATGKALMPPKGDLQPLGFFSTATSVGIGDPFVKKPNPDPREVGKQFLTSPSKRGQIGDNWGKKSNIVNRLFEGDQYVDPAMPERKARLESRKKNLTTTGFVPSSPPKKPIGLGTYYGCIGGVNEYLPQGPPPKAKPTHEPRQVQTSPGKKGSYGFRGTTIGSEPSYATDSYAAAAEAEREDHKTDLKKRVGGAFKSTSRPVDFFDSYPKVAASKVYTTDRELPPPKNLPQKLDPIARPFVPSHTPYQGYNSTFMRFPDYKESPYDSELRQTMEMEHTHKKKIIGSSWKPSSTPKSTVQSSIITRNITYNSVSMNGTV